MITNTATGYKELGYPAWEMLVAQSVAIVDPDPEQSLCPHALQPLPE